MAPLVLASGWQRIMKQYNNSKAMYDCLLMNQSAETKVCCYSCGCLLLCLCLWCCCCFVYAASAGKRWLSWQLPPILRCLLCHYTFVGMGDHHWVPMGRWAMSRHQTRRTWMLTHRLIPWTTLKGCNTFNKTGWPFNTTGRVIFQEKIESDL